MQKGEKVENPLGRITTTLNHQAIVTLETHEALRLLTLI